MKKLIALMLPVLLATPNITHAAPATPAFQEGVSYEKILPAQPTASSQQVEIVELFWYGCPHCHRFQAYIEKWLETKPANVNYIRMPAILSEKWALHARAFYTAEALGITNNIHRPLFDAIHVEKKKFNSEKELSDFFVKHGAIDSQTFTRTFHSFTVDSKVRRARLMTKRYQTKGTPSIVINGKYRTGPGLAKNFNTLMQVIKFLVRQESLALK